MYVVSWKHRRTKLTKDNQPIGAATSKTEAEKLAEEAVERYLEHQISRKGTHPRNPYRKSAFGGSGHDVQRAVVNKDMDVLEEWKEWAARNLISIEEIPVGSIDASFVE